jgi:hypothetical protein
VPPVIDTPTAAEDPGNTERRQDLIPEPAGRIRFTLDGPLTAYVAMILLGLAAGWQCSASQKILAAAIGPDAETTAMVVAIALLAAAVGPWLPGRLIVGVARLIQKRGWQIKEPNADITSTLWMLRAVRGRDDSLLWLSISVLSCTAGGLSLITLLLMDPFAQVYQYLLQHFFWTSLTLSGIEWLGTAVVIGPSWIVHGLLISTLAAVVGRNEPARQPPGVIAGAVAGPGLALLISATWGTGLLSGGQEFMAGVLPVFVVAALAAKMSQRTTESPNAVVRETAAPELPGRAEGLIWLLLVIWGIAAALAGTGWVLCRQVNAPGWASPHTQWGWYITVLGAGTAAAWWHARHQTRSTSGCGMAAWAAGIGAGGASAMAAFRPAGMLSGIIQVLLLGLTFGYALHYAELAWLARSGSETQGFAQLASAVLAGLAAGFMAARWWAVTALGPVGLMTAGALLMMALGGIVQIYEEDRPARIRHRRLALVFASLAGAILLFPAATGRWDTWETSHRVAPASTELTWLAAAELAPARRVCLIGVDGNGAIRWPGLGKARVDVFARPTAGAATGSSDRPPGRTRLVRASPFRALRLEHQVYDLVYQQGCWAGRTDSLAEYSVEWLSRLASLTMPDGEIVIDVPLAGMTPEAVVTIATTLERAANAPVRWTSARLAGQPVFRLAANPESSEMPTPDDATWAPADLLLAGHERVRIHSIQRDRITPLIETAPSPSAEQLLRWLDSHRDKNRTGPVRHLPVPRPNGPGEQRHRR